MIGLEKSSPIFMKTSAQELAIINYSLSTTGQVSQDGRPMPRTFPANELQRAIDLSAKIEKNVKDGAFIDGECDFSTEEKAYIIALLNRPFGLADGKIKIELEKKLK